MVKQKKPTYHKPIPITQKIQLWANETLEAIQKNFKTQGIFPIKEEAMTTDTLTIHE